MITTTMLFLLSKMYSDCEDLKFVGFWAFIMIICLLQDFCVIRFLSK